jgi:flagellar motor switch protein FliN/FliY
MTPALAEAQLELAQAAARAAVAVLPSSEPLEVGAALTDLPPSLPAGQAVTARFTGAASGEVTVVVGQDLADALRQSPLGELDLVTAVRSALEAVAGTFGPVVLDPGLAGEPEPALRALVGKGNAAVVPLVSADDPDEPRAIVAMALDPWPGTGGAAPGPGRGGGAQVQVTGTSIRAGLDLLHDVEMEVSAELGRTRMSVRELLSLAPGAIVELDRAAGSPADLLVNGRLVARGEVVIVDENFAIRITEIMSVGGDRS